MSPTKSVKEISIEEWVEKKIKEGYSLTMNTAKNWARNNELPAKIKNSSTTVTVTRRVRKYMIPEDAEVPLKYR